jgi:hypothetical protein
MVIFLFKMLKAIRVAGILYRQNKTTINESFRTPVL